MTFSIKDFFRKCDQMWPDLVTFTKEILNGKLRFFCSGPYFRLLLVNSRYFWLRLVSKGLFIWDISRRPDISYKCDNCHPTWVRWFTSQLVRVSFFLSTYFIFIVYLISFYLNFELLIIPTLPNSIRWTVLFSQNNYENTPKLDYITILPRWDIPGITAYMEKRKIILPRWDLTRVRWIHSDINDLFL